MAPSEWMQSVRAVRDIPVAAYPAPGINTMHHVAYRPPIAVSPFHLAPSVLYFKRTVWRWRPTVTIRRNGFIGYALHQDCNAMGDAAKTSSRIPSTCAQNAILSLLIIHIIPSRKIYVAIGNPSLVPAISCLTTSSYLWNYVHPADDVSHAENLPSNYCWCFSHFYKFRDRIQVTWVFRYRGECQG